MPNTSPQRNREIKQNVSMMLLDQPKPGHKPSAGGALCFVTWNTFSNLVAPKLQGSVAITM